MHVWLDADPEALFTMYHTSHRFEKVGGRADTVLSACIIQQHAHHAASAANTSFSSRHSAQDAVRALRASANSVSVLAVRHELHSTPEALPTLGAPKLIGSGNLHAGGLPCCHRVVLLAVLDEGCNVPEAGATLLAHFNAGVA